MEIENNDNLYSDDNNRDDICSICQNDNGVIICKNCSPTNIFCQKCNDSIHQLPSKKNHNQKFYLIKKNDENIEDYLKNKEISSKRIFNKNNNSNLESTFSQTFRTNKYEPLSYDPSKDSILNNFNQSSRMKNEMNSFNNINKIENNLTYYNYIKNKKNNDFNQIYEDEKIEKENIIKSPVTNNYLEKMRKIYEGEQKNIRLQQYQLCKELSKTEEENERKINDLNTQINNTKSQNENDIKNLMKENEYEIKKVLNKKENEINMLSNRYFELERANNDLLEKINNISNKISQDKINNKDKIDNYQIEINNINKNNNDLKNYYEKKLEYIIRIFAEEKNKLIASYETHIDKVNIGYMKSKNEYIKQAQNKDNNLRNILNNYNSDTNKLNNEIKNLNEEIIKLKNEEQELIYENNKIQKDNNILRENYENLKKDLRYQIKQKENFEQNFAFTQRKFYALKADNEKLNRLTYGNFKRSKSKIH